MKDFLSRISSRKFLLAFTAQVAALVALCWPEYSSEAGEIGIRVAAIISLSLASMGYGKANVDEKKTDIKDEVGKIIEEMATDCPK